MENYTSEEIFTLPSLGKIYGVEVNPNIKMRSMTTNEEMRRLSKSDRQYKILADIIDECILDKLPISSYDMCIGDFQYLMKSLRVVTYGEDYKVQISCPYCLSTENDSINLNLFESVEYNEDLVNKLKCFDLPISKKNIILRMQTPRMLDDIELKTKEFNKKISSNSESAFLFGLVAAIEKVDGENVDPLKLESFLRNLPMKDTNTILQNYEALNNSIGMKAEISVECGTCGLDYTIPFRVTKEFFRPSL